MPIPYYYIAGVSKCETYDLHFGIQQHLDVALGFAKEIAYWNRMRYDSYPPMLTSVNNASGTSLMVPRPFRHYLNVFDPTAQKILFSTKIEANTSNRYHYKITGDDTPSHFYEFDGRFKMTANRGLAEPKYILANIIHQITLKAKIILIFRDPVDRLYLEYMFFGKNAELSQENFLLLFERGYKAFQMCLSRMTLRSCIYDDEVDLASQPLRLKVGLYHPFLCDWMNAIPRDQFFITRMEEYPENRLRVPKGIVEFLEIDALAFVISLDPFIVAYIFYCFNEFFF
ncbi:hypothetical protein CAPTEDRAFT_193481 [Capitella teleta]|uniref:Sulfotransferase domain-containing protein n=1 Tax=Capitella teleta TaxID=283909 RepID=R7TTY9_CAPTE|nr:hypothetical protein CAPTEDRAFT_193481 [Capitella teleta]|eukprot:ELT97144.1 hypothetical protein CAPTEDRAFT_193481 [Capitella teleta]